MPNSCLPVSFHIRPLFLLPLVFLTTACDMSGGDDLPADRPADWIARLQEQAVANGRSPVAYWGTQPDDYVHWGSHSNRLIPVYTFGTGNMEGDANLDAYIGEQSGYRDSNRIADLYGRVPENTLNPEAAYMDQCDLYSLQQAAIAAGKKYVFLVVFDGMDWQTSQAAAIYRTGRVGYTEGRGTGLHIQDYTANDTTQFGWMVTSPHNQGTTTNVDEQSVSNFGGTTQGGYDSGAGGSTPWAIETVPDYLISESTGQAPVHAYTDSAASATSMATGLKTYNAAINVGPDGEQLTPITHQLQQNGFSVGIVTSVPFCHATPAAAYAHNVSRKDYQDLARDMLGLPSVSHPANPLPGLDVVMGAGYGEIEMNRNSSGTKEQGDNLVRGGMYVTADDLNRISLANGGDYVLAVRQPGTSGSEHLEARTALAIERNARLFGFFGATGGHLPYATANGDFQPVHDRDGKLESYGESDLLENPTLAEMTDSAVSLLHARQKPFWLMIEAGDVDWANHSNNLDSSIGAVFSGDAAVRVVTNWVETNSNWDESLMIVTADHGHALHLVQPEALAGPLADNGQEF